MKKIELGMWVPNSERGLKMLSLEGEIEIPHIPKLDFFNDLNEFYLVKLVLQPSTGAKII